MKDSIIIVGGGISGLAAGCYAQMNGYHTEIFEMNKMPGGLCTAWERKGYRFDISMHMLMGSVSGPIHKMWKELGIIDNFRFHFHERMSRIEARDHTLELSTQREKLEEALLSISPADKKLIREFTSVIFGPDLMSASSLKPAGLTTLPEKIRMIPAYIPLLKYFIRYNNVSVQQFAERFRHPFLKKAVRFFIDSPGWPMPDFPMIALTGFMRSAVLEAGTPLGGSQQVVFHIAKLYEKLGGTLHLRSRVKDLIIENDSVKGIVSEDGTERKAGHVIWAADGHTLHYGILGGRYLDDAIRNMYENWIPVKPLVHVMIGVNRDFSGEPHHILIESDEPVIVAGEKHHWFPVLNHSFDKSMAPAGKSSIEVWFETESNYWEKLSSDREAYNAEKKSISAQVIIRLEKRWPGFASQVEVIDVPTPATYIRYTGNWKGSPDGWYITTNNMMQMEPVRSVKNLAGLSLAGQWTSPFTGTVMAALSGRQIIQILCHKEGREFKTETPAEVLTPEHV